MKELLRFSLVRRFNNKSTKLFNAIVLIVVFAFVFSDKLMYIFNPHFLEPKVIYTKGIEEDLLLFLNENANEEYVFKNTKDCIADLAEDNFMVLEKQDTYTLHTKYTCNPLIIANMNLYLNMYRKEQILQNSKNIEVLLSYNHDIQIENKVIDEQTDLSLEKQNLIFVFVTGVYFMMISFVSTVASEVVNEKATKTLELILTSVEPKVHFWAKVLVGWFVILIQSVLTLSYLVFALCIRNIYDQGSGLLNFVKKLKLFPSEAITFANLIEEMDLSYLFFEKLFYVLLFLVSGILLVQIVMVIVSSFVSSSEEAGNIQAPFYLVLLGFYYLTIALNTPEMLNEGIGFYLSFVPFLNMLLMPCRILVSSVSFFQLSISLMLSFLLILFALMKGIPVYERGVLDYSCKGFKQVIKAMKEKK